MAALGLRLHEAVGVLLHEDPEISDRNVRTSRRGIAPYSLRSLPPRQSFS